MEEGNKKNERRRGGGEEEQQQGKAIDQLAKYLSKIGRKVDKDTLRKVSLVQNKLLLLLTHF